MKKNTYYHLVLDKSGSMDSCWSEARQVIMQQLVELKRVQKENPESRIFFSYCAFNQALRFSNEIMDLETAKIDWLTIYPDGMTALYDAIGESISYIQKKGNVDFTQGNSDVVMLILTDGHENASKKHIGMDIKEMLQAYESSGNWNFLFLGAGLNITEVTENLDRGNKNSISFEKSDFQETFTLVNEELEEFIKSKSMDQKKRNFFDKKKYLDDLD